MKTIYLLILLCSAIASFVLSLANTDNQTAKNERLNRRQIDHWRNDIDFMQQQLEDRHIDLYHSITAESFNNEIARIKQQLPLLTEPGVMVELMRLIKQVGDGHTQFAHWGGPHHRYPIELRLFGDDFRLISVEHKHKDLLGAALIAIDEMPIIQVRRLLIPVLQGVENIHSEKQRLPETIVIAEVLQGLTITKSLEQAEFTFKLPTGGLRKLHLNSVSQRQLQTQAMSSLDLAKPANFTRHKISIDGIDLLLSTNSEIAYLDFYRYPKLSRMNDFAEDLTNLLRQQKTRNVIIDLRNNGGGDFFVGLQLAWALIMVDNLNWREGIYVLIGPKTFSAAMSNAVQYRQLLNARLVGEPTGANPVGYQDADTFSLPHSGWTVMYSKRRYRFQDFASAGVLPDIIVNDEWEDYRKGFDRGLEWVLKDIQARNNRHH